MGRHEHRNGNKTNKSDAWRTNKTKNKTVLEGRIRKETRRKEDAWGVSLETLKTAAEFLLGPTPQAPITSERRDGPTPHGGAYSIAYFRDKRGAPTTKERAASVEIVEHSAAGDEIARTYFERH